MKLPKTLGACVDALYKMREQRLAAQKIVDASKTSEEALKLHVLNNFNRQEVEKSSGKLATCAITRRVVAEVQDWDALFKYVSENDAFDLLQKRVNDTAYRARLEENVEVPGIEPFEVVSLSITKR
jgi:hypothetical protein